MPCCAFRITMATSRRPANRSNSQSCRAVVGTGRAIWSSRPTASSSLSESGLISNVDDPDTHSDEKGRATDLADESLTAPIRTVYAYGIRNAGGGLAIEPKTGELWCSVNERDELGNNLVPDYITHVEQGGFYGWPYYYIGGNPDPRLKGAHPELKSKVIVPDVLIQAHNASMGMTFY